MAYLQENNSHTERKSCRIPVIVSTRPLASCKEETIVCFGAFSRSCREGDDGGRVEDGRATALELAATRLVRPDSFALAGACPISVMGFTLRPEWG